MSETTKKRVLVVDDEPHILDVVQYALEKEGFEVIPAANGKEAMTKFSAGTADFIILDVNLPDASGFDLCREMRQKSKLPIIMLTSRDGEVDRVVGLELGADDYVSKPFSPRELVARVKAILRRTAEKASAPPTLDYGPFQIDREKFMILLNGQNIDLSKTEFNILEVLLRRPGKVFDRNELLSLAWSSDYVATDRTVDAHIKSIRKKIQVLAPGFEPIDTVRGVGYKIRENLSGMATPNPGGAT
jgi:DNA-binding response OmpR family regulator